MSNGRYNRAIKIGAPVYCNRTCAGAGRRLNKTAEEKKKEKAEYDEKYREANLDVIKNKKKKYFQRTYDPTQAAVVRKKRMPRHVEYCRQPKYKEYKKGYDKQFRAKKQFGEFAEAALILIELENKLDSKTIKYEQGLINKTQKRKRQWKS